MKSLFDQTKKLYTHEAFLSADELKLEAPDQRSTIRKVNLATFVSSVFGSQEVGFFHLNEHFLDTFVPDGGRLLKSQGSLYLDLKTQAYISAMSTNERTKEEILEDLFPNDMARILLSRRPGAKQLTPSEQDFVARLQHRRQHLMCDPDDDNLGEKYVWQDFLKEVSWYVSKNHEMIVAQPVGLEFHVSSLLPHLVRAESLTESQASLRCVWSQAEPNVLAAHDGTLLGHAKRRRRHHRTYPRPPQLTAPTPHSEWRSSKCRDEPAGYRAVWSEYNVHGRSPTRTTPNPPAITTDSGPV